MRNKAQWRAYFKAMLAHLLPSERALAADAIASHGLRLCQQREAHLVALFWPMRNEIDTRVLIRNLTKADVRIALPFCLDQTEMEFRLVTDADIAQPARRDALGLPAPSGRTVEVTEVDICFVPGLGFDQSGNRLGFGAGFYDRYFAKNSLTSNIYRVGIGYEAQCVAQLPSDDHDICVHAVMTEKGKNY